LSEHHLDRVLGRHLALDSIEKANEFLMPRALNAALDDLAFENVEGGEQRGGAVAFVIVGHRRAAPLLHRQTRLGAVERPVLALLVDAEHHGVGRRINIESDHLIGVRKMSVRLDLRLQSRQIMDTIPNLKKANHVLVQSIRVADAGWRSREAPLNAT
jgi:hypothetical protein